jgi:hypothetical protein
MPLPHRLRDGLRSLAVVAGLALSLPAAATTMATLSDDQLVDASSAIVRGTVVEQWTEQDALHQVWTRTQVQVDSVLKGHLPGDTIVVDQIGGSWGGRQTDVPGAVRYSVGEDVLLYLSATSTGRLSTVGMTQGKLTVRLDPYSHREIAQRFSVPMDRPYDHRFLPLPDEADRVYLSDLESDIAARVAQGWDGQPIPGATMETLRAINVDRQGGR